MFQSMKWTKQLSITKQLWNCATTRSLDLAQLVEHTTVTVTPTLYGRWFDSGSRDDANLFFINSSFLVDHFASLDLAGSWDPGSIPNHLCFQNSKILLIIK
jgi:hypothetical protein